MYREKPHHAKAKAKFERVNQAIKEGRYRIVSSDDPPEQSMLSPEPLCDSVSLLRTERPLTDGQLFAYDARHHCMIPVER